MKRIDRVPGAYLERLIIVGRFWGVDANNVGQGAGHEKPDVFALVLEPVLLNEGGGRVIEDLVPPVWCVAHLPQELV
jgi:hypothetical protein